MKRRPKPSVPEENPAAGADAILQVKFWLIGISPMVWRRVLAPTNFTLRELHGVIQVAMGWEGIHLYQSTVNAVISKHFAKRQQMRRHAPASLREMVSQPR